MEKQLIWERKLLDFSLRNNLLNTRLGRKVIPFISFGIDHLEDHLQNGEDYYITPSPCKKIEPSDDGMYDSQKQAAQYESFVSDMIAGNKIASYLTETELQDALKYVYRTARTAFEENGANSLFLALGLLRWYDSDSPKQPRYAPILLLPVDIVRKSGNKYVIRKRDEDIILNITLVELLKQEYKIYLDELKVLPKDESGVDVPKIFEVIRTAVSAHKNWTIVEESLLGLFSFNKFVMWNDIHTNADKIKENVIVASLIENRDKQDVDADAVDARNIDKDNAPMDFAIPLDVDSSQMEAIVESGRGKSFILHGPPGTGKSQTITNMIANALYQGKRVLFVAEKMAALSVVQSRLAKIHIDPFCLELHSNKATKKHFLEQMDQVLKVTKIKSPEEYAKRSQELYGERRELISYMEALHHKASNGLSLYDCISEYLNIAEDEADAVLPPKEFITADYINSCKGLVEQIDAIMEIVGQPDQNGLYGLEPSDNKATTLDALHSTLKEFKAKHAEFTAILNKMNSEALLNLQTDSDIRWLEMQVEYITTEKQRDELRETILSKYREDILKMDVEANKREWESINSKWFVSRYIAKKQYLQSLQIFGQILESGVDDMLNLVGNYQALNNNLKSRQQKLKTIDVRIKDFLPDAIEVINTNNELHSITEKIDNLTGNSPSKDDVAAHHNAWLDNYHKVNDWYHWVDKKREMMHMSLEPVVTDIEHGTQPLVAMNAFLKSVYHSLIKSTIDDNDQLRMFNGLKFRQQIAKYKRDTERFQELSKEELYSKLASKVPSSSAASAEGSEMSILKRNIANGGRGNSIRSIIDNIPNLLPRLCPCMLMSPISVAQYLDLNNDKFDIVIFDEASQMPTSEAVGAIARGKALIVVGDSKQMPPTSFFSTTQVDEDEADIDDMESILDDCITLSLCEHQLNWHYRSKHESLIAFSNSQYYGNQLLTFPSVDDRATKVTLVPVKGVYDKGHTRSNPEESKAIVKEIVRRLSDDELKKYSIGVVAFSKAQGNLIEDDLTDELDKNPALKDIAYNSKEPVFVKNLENVQGDERDVILFSIGYGADQDGKVTMNFGPLNNVGGERRLNVAVSRARYEMIVYSSLKSSQLDLKRSNAKGVEGLKYFLEYAETGKLPVSPDSSIQHNATSVMVNQICEALNNAGYITEAFVGRSNFKVDIAVTAKNNPDRYILGILCDGRTYYETKTTRDREIVQLNVLKMLNWKVMRVYSIDWYDNRERVIDQIIKELESAEKPEEPEKEAEPYVFDDETIKNADVVEDLGKFKSIKPYWECEIETTPIEKEDFNPYDANNEVIIRRILINEQPATERYLCKRLAKAMNFRQIGVNVQKAVKHALSSMYRDPFSVNGVVSYWLDEESAQDYHNYRAPSPRGINEIPSIEIANAIKEVVEEEFSLPIDKIASITAKKLGFSNTGAKISEMINAVLTALEQDNVVVVNNGSVSMNSK